MVDENPRGPIGIVTVAGMIVDGKAGPGTAGGDTIAKEIEDGVQDGIKALVVRVDSPGGSVLASERIRQALLEAKAKKIPVVVSMGSVAASGGYWVSTPADFIYAEPSTITGSIGVFGVIPSFQGTLQKLGARRRRGEDDAAFGRARRVQGPLARGQPADPDRRRIRCTARFLGIVAEARHKTPQQVDQIAQGRVWDGGTAHQLGLVDGFGGIDEAVAKAAQLAGLGNERGVRYLEPPNSFKQQLIEALRRRAERRRAGTARTRSRRSRAQPQQQLAAMLVEVRSILAGPEHPGALPRPVRRSRRRGSTGATSACSTLLEGMAVLSQACRGGGCRGDRVPFYRPYVETKPDQRSTESNAPTRWTEHGAVAMAEPAAPVAHCRARTDASLGYASSSPYHRPPRLPLDGRDRHLSWQAEAQGRGIGRHCCRRLIEFSDQQGYATAIGAIALPNPASIALSPPARLRRSGNLLAASDSSSASGPPAFGSATSRRGRAARRAAAVASVGAPE